MGVVEAVIPLMMRFYGFTRAEEAGFGLVGDY